MESHATVSLNAEIDEAVHQTMIDFLDSHEGWDQDRIINTSICLFFLQREQSLSPENYQACSRAYLDAIYSFPD